jgi:hypothetical protein
VCASHGVEVIEAAPGPADGAIASAQ